MPSIPSAPASSIAAAYRRADLMRAAVSSATAAVMCRHQEGDGIEKTKGRRGFFADLDLPQTFALRADEILGNERQTVWRSGRSAASKAAPATRSRVRTTLQGCATLPPTWTGPPSRAIERAGQPKQAAHARSAKVKPLYAPLARRALLRLDPVAAPNPHSLGVPRPQFPRLCPACLPRYPLQTILRQVLD